MSEDAPLSPLGAGMVAGLSAFCDALESGVPIEERFTVRTVHRTIEPRSYEASDVKNVRKMVDASQAHFARLLGVSIKSLRAWEHGRTRVPTATCRVLEDMIANPDPWKQRVSGSSTGNSEIAGS
jgi:putative transcriptional regulator